VAWRMVLELARRRILATILGFTQRAAVFLNGRVVENGRSSCTIHLSEAKC
jgi:hypothetical protein